MLLPLSFHIPKCWSNPNICCQISCRRRPPIPTLCPPLPPSSSTLRRSSSPTSSTSSSPRRWTRPSSRSSSQGCPSSWLSPRMALWSRPDLLSSTAQWSTVKRWLGYQNPLSSKLFCTGNWAKFRVCLWWLILQDCINHVKAGSCRLTSPAMARPCRSPLNTQKRFGLLTFVINSSIERVL